MTGHILSMILGIAVLVLLRFLPLVLYSKEDKRKVVNYGYNRTW